MTPRAHPVALACNCNMKMASVLDLRALVSAMGGSQCDGNDTGTVGRKKVVWPLGQ